MNTNQPYLNNQSQTHIAITHEASADKPYIVIDDYDASPSVRVWYAVGVTLDGVTHWDDPKIYNHPGGG